VRRLAAFAGALMAIVATTGRASAQEPVRLYAAGSLRTALTEISGLFEAKHGLRVAGTFGASGLLRDRIAGGEAAELFASANMEHPAMLAAAGRAEPVVLFARNQLCAIAKAGLAVSGDTLLTRMLDPAVKLGTSMPRADPSGDYAWALFARAERVLVGARATLESKALTLTGGPTSPPPPAGRSVYAMNVVAGNADIFLAYCTAAAEAKAEVPALQIVAIPPALAVGADYGLALMRGARPEAARLAMFVLSPDGQAVLRKHGFAAPGLPQEETRP
jgi:ABC-type molybdate transport system substrate-binding protein